VEENQRCYVFINTTDVDGLRSGEPALFLDPGQVLFEQPTQFLREHFVRSGCRRSPNTWSAAAYALASWFDFLAASGQSEWPIADRDTLIDYRDAYLLAVNPTTGRPYAPSTVALRLSFTLDFYTYAAGQGWYLGTLSNGRSDGVAIRLGSAASNRARSAGVRAGASGLFPRRALNARHILPFCPEDIQKLLSSAGPRASESHQADARDRLLVDLGWSTGLRVGEIARLTAQSFQSMRPDPDWPSGEQRLEVCGKGGYKRVIAVPNWVALDAIHYINGERARAAVSGGSSSHIAEKLFLSSLSSKTPGLPLCKRRLQQILENACISSGLTNENGGGKRLLRARYTFHQLRHTYAVFTYMAEVALGNPEPWKKIQAQLGHRFLSTTIDIYLRYVALFRQGNKQSDMRSLLGL